MQNTFLKVNKIKIPHKSGSPGKELYFNKDMPGFSHRITNQPLYFLRNTNNPKKSQSSDKFTLSKSLEIKFHSPSSNNTKGKAPQVQRINLMTEESQTPQQTDNNFSRQSKLFENIFVNRVNVIEKKERISLIQTIQRHQAFYACLNLKRVVKREPLNYSSVIQQGSRSPQPIRMNNKIAIINSPLKGREAYRMPQTQQMSRKIKTVSYAQNNQSRSPINQIHYNENFDKNTFLPLDIKGWDTQDQDNEIFKIF